MLSAQKQKMSEEPPSDHSSPPPSGFGKVLTSLQGLQQRLDDFSVEDVSHAHSQAVELIQQLGGLQARLQKLQSLYRFFESASTAIETLGRIAFDLFDTDTDGLEKHPRLRAIVRAGKLFEIHPHLLHAQTATNADPADSLKMETAVTHALVAVSEYSQSTSERAGENLRQGLVNTEEPSPATGAVHTGASPNAVPVSNGYDFAELKLDDASLQITKSEKNPGASGREKPVPSGSFDERLLKDLIESYGEFAVIDKTTPASDPFSASPKGAKDPIAERSQTEHSKNKVSTALIVAHEPKFSQPNAAPQAPPSISEKEPVGAPSSQTAPKANTRGEIDQQLKNIIKDYGEVDLYSHGKSANTNIKMIAAAAAALLILVLAGFFFFKTPSSRSSASSGAPTAEPFIPSAASAKDAVQQK